MYTIFLKMLKEWPWINQFFRFGIVGLSNTLIGLLIYEVLVFYNVHPQVANLLSFLISVLNAYYWNRNWVFKNREVRLSGVKFAVVYGSTFLLSAGLLVLWVDILEISKYIAPLCSLILTIPLNFLLNKYWVFYVHN